jgi:hypothetical protein
VPRWGRCRFIRVFERGYFASGLTGIEVFSRIMSHRKRCRAVPTACACRKIHPAVQNPWPKAGCPPYLWKFSRFATRLSVKCCFSFPVICLFSRLWLASDWCFIGGWYCALLRLDI